MYKNKHALRVHKEKDCIKEDTGKNTHFVLNKSMLKKFLVHENKFFHQYSSEENSTNPMDMISHRWKFSPGERV